MLAVVLAACSTPAPVTELSNRTDRMHGAPRGRVTLQPYGDIAIDDGGFAVMDHNNGDKRVHVMTISRDFRGTVRSWDDQTGPPTEVRSKAFRIDPHERAEIQTWSEQLWPLARVGAGATSRPAAGGTLEYEWAIVLRRGDEVRVLDGSVASGTRQPDSLENIVDFLDMHF